MIVGGVLFFAHALKNKTKAIANLCGLLKSILLARIALAVISWILNSIFPMSDG